MKGSALVSGASSGLGRAISIAFATSGVPVVGVGRSLDRLAETGSMCEPSGTSFASIVAEATDDDAVRSAVAVPDRLSHCIVNAGVTARTPFLDIDAAELRHLLEVNVVGSFLLMRAAAARMSNEGGGRIVVIASDLGLVARAQRASYVASKHALVGLARTLDAEHTGDGVLVTTVFSGSISTPMNASLPATGRRLDVDEVARSIVGTVLAAGASVAIPEIHYRSARRG